MGFAFLSGNQIAGIKNMGIIRLLSNYTRWKLFEKGPVPENTRDDIKDGYEYYKGIRKNKDDTISRVAFDVGEELGKVAEGIGETLKDMA
jgi:hypothetical protein